MFFLAATFALPLHAHAQTAPADAGSPAAAGRSACGRVTVDGGAKGSLVTLVGPGGRVVQGKLPLDARGPSPGPYQLAVDQGARPKYERWVLLEAPRSTSTGRDTCSFAP